MGDMSGPLSHAKTEPVHGDDLDVLARDERRLGPGLPPFALNLHPSLRIEVGRGEEVELILPGNPSTGYLWVVAEVSPILTTNEPEFRPESTLVGAPGEYHFRLTGNEPGTVLLVAEYERPFEEAEPLDTFEVEVTVK